MYAIQSRFIRNTERYIQPLPDFLQIRLENIGLFVGKEIIQFWIYSNHDTQCFTMSCNTVYNVLFQYTFIIIFKDEHLRFLYLKETQDLIYKRVFVAGI